MLKGSIVALITPMLADGRVDYDALERLVEFHINAGTTAIVAVGTTGESATLPLAQHVEVVAKVVQFAVGRIKVIGGNGANATEEAVELTKALNPLGLDAMLSVTPYYNKPSPQGLVLHYKAIAAASDVGQILYNVPGRTAVDMLPDTVAELATVDNIIGIKEATGDVSRVGKLRKYCPSDFLLFSGDDATAKEFILRGGDGVISVVNNILPKLFQEMCQAALKGDAERASELNEPMIGLYKALFVEANPIPVKWAAHQMKLMDCGVLRLPLTELQQQNHQQVLAAMRQAGIEVN
ncbi:4-hydroxy-tetrahydrodipicolinate synthase [Paraferrimonas haliotis]|uniref:4-hydroxy-tetrahydrodipicolinate synthase n=1 Tax=Paraferrimonas haliotis TaxID=2013866 RepID=A0AA37TP72_9GAMM|nr:4-hydroxy-tetrahydrodipicolinate synthase [Paraferrimonas haliotis]GLS84283.1 4-hydroxy-tetrahydrodipicolinate synthase [Paraferrimonas haliotis]